MLSQNMMIMDHDSLIVQSSRFPELHVVVLPRGECIWRICGAVLLAMDLYIFIVHILVSACQTNIISL